MSKTNRSNIIYFPEQDPDEPEELWRLRRAMWGARSLAELRALGALWFDAVRAWAGPNAVWREDSAEKPPDDAALGPGWGESAKEFRRERETAKPKGVRGEGAPPAPASEVEYGATPIRRKRAASKGLADPTDDRIADIFAEEHSNDLRYVAAWGKWFEWRGGCWREEKTLRAFHLIRTTCKAHGIERASMAKMVGAVQTLARADRRLAATIEQWDADAMLLNTPDGVVDLSTGELRRHRPGDYMTMIAAVGPRGACPKWEKFLHEITGGDEALIAYLKRVAGYCLTGSTDEQAMFFGYGSARTARASSSTPSAASSATIAGRRPSRRSPRPDPTGIRPNSPVSTAPGW
jgi:D5 N terminal like